MHPNNRGVGGEKKIIQLIDTVFILFFLLYI